MVLNVLNLLFGSCLQDASTGLAPEIEAMLLKKKSLFQKVNVPEDKGIPNVVEEQGFFEWAGAGVTQEDAYQLLLSMTKLKSEHSLSFIRFFGKVCSRTILHTICFLSHKLNFDVDK